jgi:hypothetical protein
MTSGCQRIAVAVAVAVLLCLGASTLDAQEKVDISGQWELPGPARPKPPSSRTARS